MKYRASELLSATDLGASGTKTIDVNVQDPISRIDIMYKTTKSKHGMDSYTHKNITKIELVDGSDVLFSMDGGQCQALAIYGRPAPTMSYGQHLSANSEFDTYPIDFGRWLWDELLALDPKQFRNLQLKITYDYDVADTGVTVSECVVVAHCFDEKVISPIGFLMGKTHWQTLMGADGTYSDIDLPTDYPIRKMLIQGYRSGYEPWNTVEDVRLSEDNLKRIVFDWNVERYYRMMKSVWKPVEETFVGLAGVVATYRYFTTPTDYWISPVFTAFGNGFADCLFIDDSLARGGVFYLSRAAGTCNAAGIIRGYLPNHCIEFPFGDPKDLDDWYDVTTKGSVKVRLESGGAGVAGQGAVVLEQLRRY